MYNNREYRSTNIAGAATTTVFTGKGILHSIVINNAAAGGTITVTDRTSPVVTIATITLTSSPFVAVEYNATVASDLQVVTSASPNITVMWTQS